ncbi:hypothetical protein CARUB_v10021311mg [Capsella rubella]|uniref:F-box domain-containing protein n=1 Tax=Capsella rubella TaxID=81985 RepID=R0GDW9_9BRAS|nr:putative F-box/kelch-repeat protein At3g22730 [Capsella rubella]EOA33831.1 hypothetical protein CARUB_v10021311mg [Capsella rubella]
MMSNLPQDLLEEILYRVPATCLKRIRPTCKRWYALFKDQRFCNNHFHKAPKQYRILMLKETRVSILNFNTKFIGTSLVLKNTTFNPEQVCIDRVCHCDGLLLCTTKDNRLVVWNPCLGETWCIQPRTCNKISSFALGYEENKSCPSYKILINWYKQNSQAMYEIYEFSSDSWKVLDDVGLDCVIFTNIGASLKGNTYFIAEYTLGGCLVCFDFTSERLKRLCLPPSSYHGCMALSVVGEVEQLSLLNRNWSLSKVEIWVTNNIDTSTEAALLWTKSFAVDFSVLGYCFSGFICFFNNEGTKLNVCINARFGTSMKMVHIKDNEDYHIIDSTYEERAWAGFFSYVPSLVKLRM